MAMDMAQAWAATADPSLIRHFIQLVSVLEALAALPCVCGSLLGQQTCSLMGSFAACLR
jgi:hypothetical protein